MDMTRRGGGGNCATPDLKQEPTADPHKSANSKTSDEADILAEVFCSRLYSRVRECNFTTCVVRGPSGWNHVQGFQGHIGHQVLTDVGFVPTERGQPSATLISHQGHWLRHCRVSRGQKFKRSTHNRQAHQHGHKHCHTSRVVHFTKSQSARQQSETFVCYIKKILNSSFLGAPRLEFTAIKMLQGKAGRDIVRVAPAPCTTRNAMPLRMSWLQHNGDLLKCCSLPIFLHTQAQCHQIRNVRDGRFCSCRWRACRLCT